MMDSQHALLLQHQLDALKRIATALERTNQLLYYMVPSDRLDILKKEDTDRASQALNRPKPHG